MVQRKKLFIEAPRVTCPNCNYSGPWGDFIDIFVNGECDSDTGCACFAEAEWRCVNCGAFG